MMLSLVEVAVASAPDIAPNARLLVRCLLDGIFEFIPEQVEDRASARLPAAHRPANAIKWTTTRVPRKQMGRRREPTSSAPGEREEKLKRVKKFSMNKLSPKQDSSEAFSDEDLGELDGAEINGEAEELILADAQGNVPPGAEKRWVSKKFAIKNNLLTAENYVEKSLLQKARDYFMNDNRDEMVLVYANGAVQVANASDLFGQFAANTGKIGRIVGAIAAQNGVMDKSIPAEGFVAEMLNMGSLRKEQLEALQSDKFTGVLEAVKAAQAGMQSNPTVESLETKTLDFFLIIEKKESVDGVTEVKLDDDFFTKVDDLSKNQEIAKLADGTKLYEDIVKSLTDIEQTDENPVGSARSQLSTDLQYLNEKLADLKIHKQSLSTIEQPLGDLRWMKDGNASLEKLRQFMVLVDVRSLMANIVVPGQIEEKITRTNFAAIINLSVTLKGTSDAWHSFSEVLTNRLAPLKMGRQWTSGLSHGLSDISLVESDLRDPTVMKLIPGGVTDFIDEGLKPIVNGTKMFESVDEKLKTISFPETKQAVEKLTNILKVAAAGEATPEEVFDLFENVVSCETNNRNAVWKEDREAIGEYLTSIDRLDILLNSLGPRIKDFIATRFVQDSDLDAMIEIVNQLPSKAYQDVINEKAIEIRKILMADGKLNKFREKIQNVAKISRWRGFSSKRGVLKTNFRSSARKAPRRAWRAAGAGASGGARERQVFSNLHGSEVFLARFQGVFRPIWAKCSY